MTRVRILLLFGFIIAAFFGCAASEVMARWITSRLPWPIVGFVSCATSLITFLVYAIMVDLLLVGHNPITANQALIIAREECSRRGWPWSEQTYAEEGLLAYTVTVAKPKGGRLVVRIRLRDGAILSSRLLS